MAGLKLVLIDTNTAFAKAAKGFLESLEGVAKVTTACAMATALKILAVEGADIVIADCSALGWEPETGVSRLRHAAAKAALVLISLDDNKEMRAAGLAAGADAFLGKAEFGEKLPGLLRKQAL